jgi:radical SAM superfamily enzyme YgiQ (UPF0313 family)
MKYRKPNATQIARDRLAKEQGALLKDWGGRLPIALVYPNSYFLGMSNLGMQTVYRLFNNDPDVVCERAFYDPPAVPGPVDVISIESQRPLNDFAVIAFSLSYELDYFNAVQVLRAAHIPLFANERDGRHPLVIAGGPCMTTNPAGMAPFFDATVNGEGEDVVPQLVNVIRDGLYGDRDQLLDELAKIPGVWVPQRPRLLPVARQWVRDIGQTRALTTILTPETELDNMTLIEVARGCGRACRFCIAGYVFRPPRYRPLDDLIVQVEESLRWTNKVGLLGAAVADHPQLEELVGAADARGAAVSISSLRVDNLSPVILDALSQGGTRTVTIAPEAGSERMRAMINKALSEEQILEAADKVGAAGMRKLKLYFMYGLPGEVDEDVQALVDLGNRIKDRLDSYKKGTSLTMSVGPFVPKPATAYETQVMTDDATFKRRNEMLRKGLYKRGIELRGDGPAWARIDDICSRADGRLAGLLAELPENTLSAWKRALPQHGLDGPLPWEGTKPPWQAIDSGIKEVFFLREWDRHQQAKLTPACPPAEVTCHMCGVC